MEYLYSTGSGIWNLMHLRESDIGQYFITQRGLDINEPSTVKGRALETFLHHHTPIEQLPAELQDIFDRWTIHEEDVGSYLNDDLQWPLSAITGQPPLEDMSLLSREVILYGDQPLRIYFGGFLPDTDTLSYVYILFAPNNVRQVYSNQIEGIGEIYQERLEDLLREQEVFLDIATGEATAEGIEEVEYLAHIAVLRDLQDDVLGKVWYTVSVPGFSSAPDMW